MTSLRFAKFGQMQMWIDGKCEYFRMWAVFVKEFIMYCRERDILYVAISDR